MSTDIDVSRATRRRVRPYALVQPRWKRLAMGKHGRKKTAKTKRPKAKLGLPDLDHSKAAVLESLRSPESKRGYRHAIDEFIQWYCSEPRLSFNKIVVTRFRIASRTVASPRERSMGDWPLCDD